MKLIEIGKVVRSQGLKGRIKVLSYLESTGGLEGVPELFLGADPASAGCYLLEDVQSASGSLLLKLKGVDNRNDADRLRGCQVWADSGKMTPLEEGEYYWSDIVGLRVVAEDGAVLGRIESIFPTGSNDVYVCRSERGEFLLPAVEQMIKRIDLEQGLIVVSLPEGFFEE